MVGLPSTFPVVDATNLINKRAPLGVHDRRVPETQEMLDYCGRHNIISDVEVIPIQKINEAHERMLRQDVKYRFVIDVSSLG
jgi:uncharacterized zinc-type alcohol dehydrogenase-like protein